MSEKRNVLDEDLPDIRVNVHLPTEVTSRSSCRNVRLGLGESYDVRGFRKRTNKNPFKTASLIFL